MTYNQALGILYLFLLICLIVYLAKKRIEKDRNDEGSDFAYLTVREQLAVANRTAETIAEAEQLIEDMQESRSDDVMMLHVEWIGRDDRHHTIALACDGYNTSTACMIEISEREINDLKNVLAHQCAILSERGRSRLNSLHNDASRRGEAIEIDEEVHALRSLYLN